MMTVMAHMMIGKKQTTAITTRIRTSVLCPVIKSPDFQSISSVEASTAYWNNTTVKKGRDDNFRVGTTTITTVAQVVAVSKTLY
jgi:hypothetical protein